jgi:hypothetical protein
VIIISAARAASRNLINRPGGFLFLAIYFFFFLVFNIAYPYAVKSFWDLSALSGILILGIPIEELIFAFSFGLMWSSLYEHFNWYKDNR